MNRAYIGVAGQEPAARTADVAARGVDSDHELSNPIARVSVHGRVRGVVPRSNVPMMNMRPPQHGQGSECTRWSVMVEIALSWPRLTCPLLAAHHAAPWARKMSATSMGSPVSRRLRLKARKLPDKSSYPVTEPFDPGSLSVAISSLGTDPPSALPRQSRQISEGKLTRQTAPGRRSRQPNLTPQPPLPLWLHCDATTSVFLHLQFRYLTG